MSFGETVGLGAIAGFAIYIGLPIGRVKFVDNRLRVALAFDEFNIDVPGVLDDELESDVRSRWLFPPPPPPIPPPPWEPSDPPFPAAPIDPDIPPF